MDEKHRIEPNESLDALLDRVERGEEVVIERDGKAVARLVPAKHEFDREAAKKAAERIRQRSKGVTLGGLKIKDMIHEGHKY